ncbi:MAG: hypothetical protein RR806_07140 [Oscillospiraceae bacterium]
MQKFSLVFMIFLLCLTGCNMKNDEKINSSEIHSNIEESSISSENKYEYLGYDDYFKDERNIKVIDNQDYDKDGSVSYYREKSGTFDYGKEMFNIYDTNDFIFFCDNENIYRYFIKDDILDKIAAWEEIGFKFDDVEAVFPISNYSIGLSFYTDEAKAILEKGETPFNEDFQGKIYFNKYYNTITKKFFEPKIVEREGQSLESIEYIFD